MTDQKKPPSFQSIIIVAGTNQGKSYLTKQMVQDPRIPCFIYDVQNCYGETSTKPNDLILNLPIGTTLPRCRWFGNKLTFIDHALLRVNTTIVFEEATVFFEGKTYDTMRNLIANKWHDKNNLIFQFHSINSVPPRIMEMSDVCILFKTGDEEDNVKRKYKKLLPAFLKLQGAPDRTRINIPLQ